MQKVLIWMLGSNASGKTSLARRLHETFGNDDPETTINKLDDGKPYSYTTFGKGCANIGKVTENLCSGTDTIPSKKGVEQAYKELLNLNIEVIIADAVMSTAQWMHFFSEPKDVLVYVVLFEFKDIEANVMKVAHRNVLRQKLKQGSNELPTSDEIFEAVVNLRPKTIDNLIRKKPLFRNMYETVKQKADAFDEFDADSDMDDIQSIVESKIYELLMPF